MNHLTDNRGCKLDGKDRPPCDDTSTPTSWRRASLDRALLERRKALPPRVTRVVKVSDALRSRVKELSTYSAMMKEMQIVHKARHCKQHKPAMMSPEATTEYLLTYISGYGMGMRDYLVEHHCHDEKTLDALIMAERAQGAPTSYRDPTRWLEKSQLLKLGCLQDNNGVAARVLYAQGNGYPEWQLRAVMVHFEAGTDGIETDHWVAGFMKRNPRLPTNARLIDSLIVEFAPDDFIKAVPARRADYGTIDRAVFVPFVFLDENMGPLMQTEENCLPADPLPLDTPGKLVFLNHVLETLQEVDVSAETELKLRGGWKISVAKPARISVAEPAFNGLMAYVDVPLAVWDSEPLLSATPIRRVSTASMKWKRLLRRDLEIFIKRLQQEEERPRRARRV